MTMTKNIHPKILFLNINHRPDWTKEKTFVYYPLGLAYVMSETARKGYDFDVIDLQIDPKTKEELNKILTENEYDVVAFGALSNAYYIVKPLIAEIKNALPHAIVVVGGSIASSCTEILLNRTETDIAVMGDGEETFVEILNKISRDESTDCIRGIAFKRNGSIINAKPRPPLKSLDELSIPNWDLLDVESYISSAKQYKNIRSFSYLSDIRPFFMFTQRGCPYRCTFCYNSLYHRYNPYRKHSKEYIIAMMKRLKAKYDVDFLWLVDELTFLSVENATPLIDALIEENIGVSFQATARVGFLKKGDGVFATKLKKAGCIHLTYSMESGSPKILKAMNKKINIKDYAVQKKILDDAGIISTNSLVLGYPQETEETIAETFQVCYENDSYPSVGFLMPLPGSLMYSYALKKGYITDEEDYLLDMSDRQFLNINMTQMSDERFLNLVKNHLKRIRDKLEIDLPDDQLICHTIIEKDGNTISNKNE